MFYQVIYIVSYSNIYSNALSHHDRSRLAWKQWKRVKGKYPHHNVVDAINWIDIVWRSAIYVYIYIVSNSDIYSNET